MGLNRNAYMFKVCCISTWLGNQTKAVLGEIICSSGICHMST